jgi:hypothetical protein
MAQYAAAPLGMARYNGGAARFAVGALRGYRAPRSALVKQLWQCYGTTTFIVMLVEDGNDQSGAREGAFERASG